MMKNIKVFALLIALLSCGQSIISSVKITLGDKVIGKDIVRNKDIIAKEFTLPGLIQKSYYDTLTNTVTLVQQEMNKSRDWLKAKGNIIVFNLHNNKAVWDKGINYENSIVLQYNNEIFHEQNNKVDAYNLANGDKMWENKINFKYIDPGMKVGMGYTFRAALGESNMLKGIDLTTGKELWKRPISQEYDWSNQVLIINDSVILIAAAGLHTINLRTGKGWDYNAITGENETYVDNDDIYGMIDLHAFTRYSGVFLKNQVVANVASNILSDNGYIYFASKEILSKIDLQGNLIWTHPLPSKKTSNSKLILKDGKLLMVNKGYALYNENLAYANSSGRFDVDNYSTSALNTVYKKKKYGVVYLTSFDAATGEQSFFTELDNEDDLLQDVKILDHKILLLYKDIIKIYSSKNGAALKTQKHYINMLDPFSGFLNNAVFLKNKDGGFQKISPDEHTYLVITKDRNLIVINSELVMLRKLVVNSDYYNFAKQYKSLDFFSNKTKTLILNNNKRIAELNVSDNTIIHNDFLYDLGLNSLIKIDLRPLLR